jgi:hypothetical protein
MHRPTRTADRAQPARTSPHTWATWWAVRARVHTADAARTSPRARRTAQRTGRGQRTARTRAVVSARPARGGQRMLSDRVHRGALRTAHRPTRTADSTADRARPARGGQAHVHGEQRAPGDTVRSGQDAARARTCAAVSARPGRTHGADSARPGRRSVQRMHGCALRTVPSHAADSARPGAYERTWAHAHGGQHSGQDAARARTHAADSTRPGQRGGQRMHSCALWTAHARAHAHAADRPTTHTADSARPGRARMRRTAHASCGQRTPGDAVGSTCTRGAQ